MFRKNVLICSKHRSEAPRYFSGNVKIAGSFRISKFESSCILYSYTTNARTNVDKFHENSSEPGKKMHIKLLTIYYYIYY